MPFGLFERLCVETHPVLLHSCQHGHERHFDVVKHTLHLVRPHLGLEERFEGEGDVGIFAGVVDDGLWFDVGHVFLRASRPNELVDVDGAIVEVDFGKVVEVVALFGLHHIVGEHRVEKWCAHLHPIMREHRKVVFEILPHFQNFVIFKNRTQGIDKFLGFVCFTWNADVPSSSAFHRKTHSDQFCSHRID